MQCQIHLSLPILSTHFKGNCAEKDFNAQFAFCFVFTEVNCMNPSKFEDPILSSSDIPDPFYDGPIVRGRPLDDSTRLEQVDRQLEQVLETMARVGGEVCQLRAEMDGVLEQNGTLMESFKKLKEVIYEKGLIDLDDFQLACDVFEEMNVLNKGSSFSTFSNKKHSH
jgi:hypothetical protein